MPGKSVKEGLNWATVFATSQAIGPVLPTTQLVRAVRKARPMIVIGPKNHAWPRWLLQLAAGCGQLLTSALLVIAMLALLRFERAFNLLIIGLFGWTAASYLLRSADGQLRFHLGTMLVLTALIALAMAMPPVYHEVTREDMLHGGAASYAPAVQVTPNVFTPANPWGTVTRMYFNPWSLLPVAALLVFIGYRRWSRRSRRQSAHA